MIFLEKYRRLVSLILAVFLLFAPVSQSWALDVTKLIGQRLSADGKVLDLSGSRLGPRGCRPWWRMNVWTR